LSQNQEGVGDFMYAQSQRSVRVIIWKFSATPITSHFLRRLSLAS